MSDDKKDFPIQGGDRRPSFTVPWAMMAPHEAWAKRNHDQSINRLAERGGLCPNEAICVLDGLTWRDRKFATEELAAEELKRRATAFIASAPRCGETSTDLSWHGDDRMRRCEREPHADNKHECSRPDGSLYWWTVFPDIILPAPTAAEGATPETLEQVEERMTEAMKRAQMHCKHVNHGQRLCCGCAGARAAHEHFRDSAGIVRLPDDSPAPAAAAAVEGDALTEAIGYLEANLALRVVESDLVHVSDLLRTASSQMAALRQENERQRKLALNFEEELFRCGEMLGAKCDYVEAERDAAIERVTEWHTSIKKLIEKWAARDSPVIVADLKALLK